MANITAQSIQQLEPFALLGKGVISDVLWSPVSHRFVLATPLGLFIYRNLPNPDYEFLPLRVVDGYRALFHPTDDDVIIGHFDGHVEIWNPAAFPPTQLCVFPIEPTTRSKKQRICKF